MNQYRGVRNAFLTLVCSSVALACVYEIRQPEVNAVLVEKYLTGGHFFPKATGKWFHQYRQQENVVRALEEEGFRCEQTRDIGSPDGTEQVSCQRRGYEWISRLFSRVQTIRLSFRGNGSLEFAEASCAYRLIGYSLASHYCRPYVAKGVVYPDVAAFAQTVQTVMLATRTFPASGANKHTQSIPPVRDANDARDRLIPWGVSCDAPTESYGTSFQGKVGTAEVLVCQQHSLRPLDGSAQSQQILIHYDSIELGVRSIEVRLDEARLKLPSDLIELKAGSVQPVQSLVQLERNTGERLSLSVKDIGTGSGAAQREGFESLTPSSQREFLGAYLGKVEKEWNAGNGPARFSELTLALHWYGSQALPHLKILLSDDHPRPTAAVLKYLCTSQSVIDPQQTLAYGSPEHQDVIKSCFDQHRAALPKSYAMLDHLLARDFSDLITSNTRTLNAFANFSEYVLAAVALGPSAREARTALRQTVANKDGFEPKLQALLDQAL